MTHNTIYSTIFAKDSSISTKYVAYEDEILIYLIATNNGSSTMYVDVDDSLIIQNAKQYSAQSDLYADYQLPYKIATGVEAAGVVSFPAIEVAPFDYIIEIHSDNFDEDFDTITYKLTLDPSAISQEKPEEHAEKASTTNTAQTNTNYRNEQALSRATAIVQGHSDATRQWITDCLEVENYSEEEINYALAHLSIDWSQCAVVYYKENYMGGPERARYYLPMQGFTPDEVQFVVDNIDWYGEAVQAAQNLYYNFAINQPIWPYGRDMFVGYLISEYYFTEDQANYGADNCGATWDEDGMDY